LVTHFTPIDYENISGNPAAGSIAQKFTSLRPQFLSAGLFPVNSKSLLSYSLDFYCQQKDVDVYVIANSKDEQLLKNELPLYDFKLVTVDDTKSIIETLQVFLQKTSTLNDDVILNVVTTIPSELPRQIPLYCLTARSFVIFILQWQK
jgi:NDP-sugar pyrophosphorylase family protein